MMEVFNIYRLIMSLVSTNDLLKQQLEDPPQKLVPALNFFKYHTGSIELYFKDKLIRIYFPIQPICRLISKTTKIKLMEEIPRDTIQEKIEGLVSCT